MTPNGPQPPGDSRIVIPRRFGALVIGISLLAATTLLAADTSSTDNVTDQLKKFSFMELMQVQVDTVIGASKHEEKINDAPANVTIVTAEEIKLYGWRTMGDVLRSVSGLLVTYDRSYAYLGVKGFNQPGSYSGHVLLTVDGHRMNDAIFDSSSMDTDFILDLDLIERIEVIRGPNSTLYGNDAIFGIINVVTRKGRDVHGAEVSGAYGSFDTYTGRVTYGNRFTNGVELLLSGTYYDSQGNSELYYPEFSSVNKGHSVHMDDGHAPSVFASLSWKELSLEAGYVDRFKREPTAQFSSPDALIAFNDPRFRTTDERAYADLKFQHTFENDWVMEARAYYDHYRYDGWYPYIYAEDNPMAFTTVNYDLQQSESVGGELQLSRRFWDKHWLTIGTEGRYDYQLKLCNEDIQPQSTYLDVNQSGYFAGVYIQDEFQVLNNLKLDAGARYDYFGNAGGTVNPRAALIYHPWKSSAFKLLYGQAYQAPNAYASYYNWPVPANTPRLNPETIRTYELEYEQNINSVWSAKASLFCNELNNLINGSGDNGYINLASATTRGIETEVAAHWANGLQGRVSYTFSKAEDSAGNRLLNSPEHLAKFNLAMPVWRKNVFASVELQAMSSRKTVQGGRVDAFCIANATLFSRELVKNLEVSASVYNLFDQHYSDPVTADFTQDTIQQDGRSFRLKLTYRF